MPLIFKLNLFKAKFNAESTSEGQCKLTPPEGEREIVWDRHFNSFAYIYISVQIFTYQMIQKFYLSLKKYELVLGVIK